MRTLSENFTYAIVPPWKCHSLWDNELNELNEFIRHTDIQHDLVELKHNEKKLYWALYKKLLLHEKPTRMLLTQFIRTSVTAFY